jgi:anti-sigma regulatory factor (Ser/Thr protein kinase)
LSTKWLGIGTEGRTGRAEPAAVWELTAEAQAASRARALTGQALRDWRITDPADIDDIVLMVDELITNAVVHGTGPVRLRLRLDGPQIVGEVTDGSPVVPVTGDAPAAPAVLDWSEAGRGLLLVCALATDFGARPEGTGKTVWFCRLLAAAP